MLDIRFGQASDPGRIRANNEDFAGSFVPRTRTESRERGWLFALADGVGGMERGEVAAAGAVCAVTDGFAACDAGVPLREVALKLVNEAHAAVRRARAELGEEMATTLVVCALRGDQALVAHVGDSRCYHVRGGRARQVTEDHTIATEQRRMGITVAGSEHESAVKHILTMSLGSETAIIPEAVKFSLDAGDVLVLCTDGVHNGLAVEEIARIVSQKRKPASEMAEELVMRAVEVDGSDNATAQVIQIRAVERTGMYRGRKYTVSA